MNSIKDKNRFKPHLIEIEDNPVSPLGRGIIWTILAFMALALLWLFLGKTDVVVSSRAEIIPVGNVKTLQSLSTGSVRAIHIKEGDSIKDGDPLIEIDPSVEESSVEAKEKNMIILELEIKKHQALIDNSELILPLGIDENIYDLITGMYLSEKESLIEEKHRIKLQINQINEELKATNIDIKKLENLYKMGIDAQRRLKSVLKLIAKDEYYQVQKENINYKSELDRKRHEIQKLQEQLKELHVQKSLIEKNFQSKIYQSLSEKEKQLSMIKAEIESINFKKKKQIIRSSVDGVVGKLAVNTIGAVVSPAEKLITIIPKDVPMQLKATVENKDIGFIREDMEVAIKVDTFDFQRYGLVAGKVKDISANAIKDEKLGLIYEVYIELEENSLMVRGEKRYFLPGMSATAELKVGKRRIIEFFIYPLVKYFNEGISVR